MKKTSFQTMKGGTGKTMLSVNIATMLAKEGRRVLLIDTDSQCNATEYLGLPMEEVSPDKCSTNLFKVEPEEDDTPQNNILVSPLPYLPTLDIIPANISILDKEAEIASSLVRAWTDSNVTPEAAILKNHFEKYASFYGKYDNIIFDTNANMGQINKNIFNTINSAIMVTDPSYDGLAGILTMTGVWRRVVDNKEIPSPNKPHEYIVLNRYNKTNVSSLAYNILKGEGLTGKQEETYGELADFFIDSPIPNSIKVAESSMMAAPIGAPHCPIPINIIDAIESLINILKERGAL